MAKTHGSVRIGPISLLTLIIMLCLAVMAVLTFSTAEASRSLTERQAGVVKTLYGDEMAAHRFMAAVDEFLVAEGGQEGFSTQTIADALPDFCEVASSLASDQGVHVDVTAQWLTPENLGATAGVPVEDVNENAVGGICMEASAETGRTLQMTLAITDRADYQLLSWKVMTVWTQEGTGETVWLGD